MNVVVGEYPFSNIVIDIPPGYNNHGDEPDWEYNQCSSEEGDEGLQDSPQPIVVRWLNGEKESRLCLERANFQ